MEALTIDALRIWASLRGLDLTDQELTGLLPLVVAAREATESLDEALTAEVEPASQYRIL